MTDVPWSMVISLFFVFSLFSVFWIPSWMEDIFLADKINHFFCGQLCSRTGLYSPQNKPWKETALSVYFSCMHCLDSAVKTKAMKWPPLIQWKDLTSFAHAPRMSGWLSISLLMWTEALAGRNWVWWYQSMVINAWNKAGVGVKICIDIATLAMLLIRPFVKALYYSP